MFLIETGCIWSLKRIKEVDVLFWIDYVILVFVCLSLRNEVSQKSKLGFQLRQLTARAMIKGITPNLLLM